MSWQSFWLREPRKGHGLILTRVSFVKFFRSELYSRLHRECPLKLRPGVEHLLCRNGSLYMPPCPALHPFSSSCLSHAVDQLLRTDPALLEIIQSIRDSFKPACFDCRVAFVFALCEELFRHCQEGFHELKVFRLCRQNITSHWRLFTHHRICKREVVAHVRTREVCGWEQRRIFGPGRACQSIAADLHRLAKPKWNVRVSEAILPLPKFPPRCNQKRT